VGASDYHPQLAVGSADGTCCTTNGLRATRRGGYVVSSFLPYIGTVNTWTCAFVSILADARTNCEQPFLVHRVYQLDYSRTDRRFRMLDRLKPREMAERPEGGGGAWHSFVGVQRVAWHSGSGPAAAGLLASATGSGLCRVDFLEGRWFRDRVPYERVEAMRLEEGAKDVDVDEPED
jgi:transcription factor C subunit 6